jgi:hypothetical protein
VASLVELCTRQPLPRADTQRFSVLVAHLENDVQGEHKNLIVEALREFPGIEVLPLDRTIPLAGPVPAEMEKQGQETARRYLEQSGAEVLIGGSVLSLHGRTIPKLYWTQAHSGEVRWQLYEAPRAEDLFRLTEVFWSDLAETLRLLIVAGQAEFEAQRGHYVADRLSPFIDRVRTLLETSAGRPGWDADARAATTLILANASMCWARNVGQKGNWRKH